MARVRAQTEWRAVYMDILHFRRELSSAGGRLTAADRSKCPREVERCERTADDRPHDDYGARAAALRPPASGSCPTHGRRRHRHGSRGASLDGPWLAPQGTEGRGQPGRDEPGHIRTSARDPGAPATREEAHGTASPRPRSAAELRIHIDARASA